MAAGRPSARAIDRDRIAQYYRLVRTAAAIGASSARRAPPAATGRRIIAARPTQPRKSTVSARNTSASAITSACRRTISASWRVAASCGVGAARRQRRGHLGQRVRRDLAPPGHGFAQPFEMQVHALVEQRVDERQADGAAEVAHQVEEAGGVLDLLRRHGAERQIVDRHHRQHQPDAAEHLRPQTAPRSPSRR